MRSGEMHVRGGLFRAGTNETGLTAVRASVPAGASRSAGSLSADSGCRGFRMQDAGCRVQGAGSRVQGTGIMPPPARRLRMQGVLELGSKVYDSRSKVQGRV